VGFGAASWTMEKVLIALFDVISKNLFKNFKFFDIQVLHPIRLLQLHRSRHRRTC